MCTVSSLITILIFLFIADYSCAVSSKDDNSLPVSYPHFVNRTEECEKIKFLLDPENPCRVVLMNGPPGMGKSATAVKLANDLEDQSEWNVLYTNCRGLHSLEDLARKISNQPNPLPNDEPISEALKSLSCQSRKTLLVLDNFETLLDLEEKAASPSSAAPSQPHAAGRVGSPQLKGQGDVKSFVADIGKVDSSVQILITSQQVVSFPGLVQENICISPMSDEDSAELLGYLGSKLDEQTTSTLLQVCGGTPLMLHTLAPISPEQAKTLKTSSPENLVDLVQLLGDTHDLPEEQQIMKCINKAYDRLAPLLQKVLIQLAVFQGPFTFSKAKYILNPEDEQQMKDQLFSLVNHSLLYHDEEPESPTFALLPAVKAFCFAKSQKDPQIKPCLQSAIECFLQLYRGLLDDLHGRFLTKESLQAIKKFRAEEKNIQQLQQWCGEEGLPIDIKLWQECVDTLNKVAELLSKLTQQEEYKDTFSGLAKRCKGDKRRIAECHTSMAIEIIFMYPTLGPPPKQARYYLTEAEEAAPIMSENSQAQRLSKLGRYCAADNEFSKGRELIEKALKIRLKREKEDPAMLAATYNDLAGVYVQFTTPNSIEFRHVVMRNSIKGKT